MKIDIMSVQMDRLGEKLFDYNYEFDSNLYEKFEIVNTEAISVKGKIIKEDDLIYVVLEYSSKFHFLCSRCLDDVFLNIAGNFKTLIVTDDEENEDGYYLEGKLLNIDDMVTEDIINNIPYSVLCKDGCLGLCSKCGSNLNHETCKCSGDKIDPRFECLKNLFT